MDPKNQHLAAQIHRLAIDLSDAGVALGDPSHMRMTAAEVERIAQELSKVSRELSYASRAASSAPLTNGALALKPR